jgi:hypothetical protein
MKQVFNCDEWLEKYPWEALITTRIPPGIRLNDAHSLIVRDVLRPIAINLSTQVGAISIIGYGKKGESHLHAHSLVLTKHRALLPVAQDGVSNFELVESLRSRPNQLLSHERALDIRNIYSAGAISYVADHLTLSAELRYYNRKLLQTIGGNKNEP